MSEPSTGPQPEPTEEKSQVQAPPPPVIDDEVYDCPSDALGTWKDPKWRRQQQIGMFLAALKEQQERELRERTHIPFNAVPAPNPTQGEDHGAVLSGRTTNSRKQHGFAQTLAESGEPGATPAPATRPRNR